MPATALIVLVHHVSTPSQLSVRSIIRSYRRFQLDLLSDPEISNNGGADSPRNAHTRGRVLTDSPSRECAHQLGVGHDAVARVVKAVEWNFAKLSWDEDGGGHVHFFSVLTQVSSTLKTSSNENYSIAVSEQILGLVVIWVA